MATEQSSEGAVPSSQFFETLIGLNRLDAIGFSRLIFVPGMLFGSSETWWPGGGVRPASHEGIDLCVFETADGRRCRLDETVRVPMAYDGEIVGQCKDFLGKTVIARHRLPGTDTPLMYALYAHIQPESGLSIGDFLSAGDPVGRIAPIVSGKTPLPPHLHLTFGRSDLLPPANRLNWPALNRLERSVFYDPLQVLHLPWRTISHLSETFDAKMYPAVQRFRV